uniref:Guanylate-binding protein N-terminal domain-containing protein n=1 Tax=Chromera velia CCMP2878 TaxID=1169474 RepID=A0A0G4HEN6_9ALVE|eukprot:Cvel_6577.t1-p1 / transcript=Cvel_6577.t1 / gene=Cvel_6577 / organism=Chromera_velia_CCMP2878 / gene_product=hypothetical protein / transcript_product=hypothetical protein / location=Cvel_scaffold324:61867-69091(+) / protein_length=909 / sequence_SO=supercontig / SO=protein_coding / is_pseudo=false
MQDDPFPSAMEGDLAFPEMRRQSLLEMREAAGAALGQPPVSVYASAPPEKGSFDPPERGAARRSSTLRARERRSSTLGQIAAIASDAKTKPALPLADSSAAMQKDAWPANYVQPKTKRAQPSGVGDEFSPAWPSKADVRAMSEFGSLPVTASFAGSNVAGSAGWSPVGASFRQDSALGRGPAAAAAAGWTPADPNPDADVIQASSSTSARARGGGLTGLSKGGVLAESSHRYGWIDTYPSRRKGRSISWLDRMAGAVRGVMRAGAQGIVQPLQLVAVERDGGGVDKLRLCPEGVEALQNFQGGPLTVVAFSGQVQSGKSLLANLVTSEFGYLGDPFEAAEVPTRRCTEVGGGGSWVEGGFGMRPLSATSIGPLADLPSPPQLASVPSPEDPNASSQRKSVGFSLQGLFGAQEGGGEGPEKEKDQGAGGETAEFGEPQREWRPPACVICVRNFDFNFDEKKAKVPTDARTYLDTAIEKYLSPTAREVLRTTADRREAVTFVNPLRNFSGGSKQRLTRMALKDLPLEFQQSVFEVRDLVEEVAAANGQHEAFRVTSESPHPPSVFEDPFHDNARQWEDPGRKFVLPDGREGGSQRLLRGLHSRALIRFLHHAIGLLNDTTMPDPEDDWKNAAEPDLKPEVQRAGDAFKHRALQAIEGTPIDEREFTSRLELEKQKTLESFYASLGGSRLQREAAERHLGRSLRNTQRHSWKLNERKAAEECKRVLKGKFSDVQTKAEGGDYAGVEALMSEVAEKRDEFLKETAGPPEIKHAAFLDFISKLQAKAMVALVDARVQKIREAEGGAGEGWEGVGSPVEEVNALKSETERLREEIERLQEALKEAETAADRAEADLERETANSTSMGAGTAKEAVGGTRHQAASKKEKESEVGKGQTSNEKGNASNQRVSVGQTR